MPKKNQPGSIGLRLLNFGRVRIDRYHPAPNFASRSKLPPSWQEAADEPLIWKDAEPEAEALPPMMDDIAVEYTTTCAQDGASQSSTTTTGRTEENPARLASDFECS